MDKPHLTKARLNAAGVGAFFRPRDVLPLGVSFRQLQRLVAEGTVEKPGGGVYRLSEVEPNEFETIAMVATAAPDAIVCLLTALRVHEIGTQSPHQVWLAIDRKARKPRRLPTQLRIVRFSGAMLTYGVVTQLDAGRPGLPHESRANRRRLLPLPEQDRARCRHGGAARRGALAQGHGQRDRPRCRGLPHADRHRPYLEALSA